MQVHRIRAAVLRKKGGPPKIEPVEREGPRDDEVLVRMVIHPFPSYIVFSLILCYLIVGTERIWKAVRTRKVQTKGKDAEMGGTPPMLTLFG